MPVRIYGINGNSGGLGDKSLILPDNIDDLTIATEPSYMTLTWSIPDSEVPIDHFNVYIQKAADSPNSIDEMNLHETLDSSTTTMQIDNLDTGSYYYIVITSVSIDGYENASIRGMKGAELRAGYWLMGGGKNFNTYAGSTIYYSDDGATWETLIYASNGFYNPFCVVDQVLYGSSNGTNAYVEGINSTSGTRSYSYSLGTKYFRYMVYDQKKYVVAWTSGGSYCTYYYATLNEETGYPSNNFVALSGEKPYDFGGAAYGGKAIIGHAPYNYFYVDFNKSASLQKYGAANISGYCETGAYGNGKFILGCREGRSLYILYENVGKSGAIQMETISSGYDYDFVSICYADDWNTFYAVLENGQVYYLSEDMKWVYTGSTITAGGLCFANGRLICAGNGSSSHYTLNGTSWIAMSGASGNDTTFSITSKY